MARFVPQVRLDEISHDSERIVFEALLPLADDYVILHSFPWLRPGRDLVNITLQEGEADFVILHPQHGMLVIEVKGGAPELRGRKWFRGSKEIRDPFDQARRNRFALLEAAEEGSRKQVHRNLFTHGELVVFPHSQYDGPLPANANPSVFVDARSIAQMPERVVAAYGAWQRVPRPLSSLQFSRLQEALMPSLRLLPSVAPQLATDERRLLQITVDQRVTLMGLLASQRVLVDGGAGSGKTLLALEFALTLARRGERVLLLCYNHHLATWLREQVAGDRRFKDSARELEIATFNAFALSLAHRAKVEFEVPSDGAQEFWEDEVPMILEQAIAVLDAAGRPPRFDAVVVDEAQDFSPDWWSTIESLTKDGEKGRLYAFLDLHQSLRGEPREPKTALPARLRLNTNCRNTKAIARSAAALAQVEVTVLAGAPDGQAPAVRRASSEAAAGVVFNEVRTLFKQGLLARQIVLIGPAAYENGLLSKSRTVDDVPLTTDAADWRRGGGLLVTTARAFKGLEADVVVLYGLEGFGPLFTRTDLYVAWTRARHRLIAICQGTEVRAAIEAALLEAEQAAALVGPPP